jgi:hypothetical protein
VVREVEDPALGLQARAKVAHGDGLARLAFRDEPVARHLHRYAPPGSRGKPDLAAWPAEVRQVRQEVSKPRSGQLARRHSDEGGESLVGGKDGLPVGEQDAVGRGVGKADGEVRLAAPEPLAGIQRHGQSGKARDEQAGAAREIGDPSLGERAFGHGDEGIVDDADSRHGGEVHGAGPDDEQPHGDRPRQGVPADRGNGEGGRREGNPQRGGYDRQRGIPGDAAGGLVCRKPQVVHGHDPGADDRAAQGA